MAQAPIPASPGSNPLRGLEGAAPSSPSKAGAARKSGESPAFRVLLDKLQAQARELEEKSQAVDAPEHLAEAVDLARASLDDALSLSDQLLESFREAELKNPDSTVEEESS